MSDFYSCFVEMVKECLDEADCRPTPITLVRHTDRVMDGPTRELLPGTEADVPVVGVTYPYDKSLIDGTAILQGDIRVVLDSQVEPLQGDDVKFDGFNFNIIDISPINPGGVIIAYFLQVRR